MGMYTELVVCANIKNVPEVIAVLKYMVDFFESSVGQPQLPNHPLFTTDRWRMLFHGSSYYFVPRAIAKLEYDDIGDYWCLITRADLKNYDSEIEKFIDWIRPYVDSENEMFAYSRYEETREPTIYYTKSTEELL